MTEIEPGFSFTNVGWTVGSYCNASCGHCYSWKLRRDGSGFLTEADINRVIQQLRRLKVKAVNLGGNEPIYTHGPDLRKTVLPLVIRKLHEANMAVGLTTNGVSFVHLNQHYPHELLMLNDIDFSLDSPFQQEHDLNRGTRLYHLVIEGIEHAHALGINCSVVVCGMRQNFNQDYLSAFLSLTKLLHCELRINMLKPVEPVLLSQMPSRDDFYQAFAYLVDHTESLVLAEPCLAAAAESPENRNAGCPCGTSSFRINPKTRDGRIPINPCVYTHDFKVGDLLADDIFDILRSPQFTAFANRASDLPRACREARCSYLEHCRGGCAARALFVCGDLEAKDPYCTQDYLSSAGTMPATIKSLLVKNHDGLRVHENYLCTWIGRVGAQFSDGRYSTLEQFLTGKNAGFGKAVNGP